MKDMDMARGKKTETTEKAPKAEKAPKVTKTNATSTEDALSQLPGKPVRGAAQREAVEAGTVNPDKVKIDRTGRDYIKHAEIKTVTGRPSVDNGDIVASTLRGHDLEICYQILVSNGGERSGRWKNLNAGMQRMAIGNALRGIARKNKGLKQADGNFVELTEANGLKSGAVAA
jgi:hypothetical protein